MDKLTAIKIKYDDGTYSDEIPVSVLSKNVEWDGTHTLVDVLGSIDVDITGTIQDQISQLFNEKVSATQLQNYVASQLNEDVSSWLNTNVNPVGSAVIVDKTLTIEGAAADAKKTGDELSSLNSSLKDALNYIPLERGYIESSTGRKVDSEYICRTKEKIALSKGETLTFETPIINGERPTSTYVAYFNGETYVNNAIAAGITAQGVSGADSVIINFIYESIIPANIDKLVIVKTFGTANDTKPYVYSGKKISIIGDSISTFNEFGFRYEGYDMYYPAEGVTKVNQTWWKEVLDTSGAVLETNLSFSASRVTKDASTPNIPDFYERVSLLGSPDIIFVALGTNDSIAQVALGEYDFATEYHSLSENSFRPAYIKGIRAIQTNYPNAMVVCIAMKRTHSHYKESMAHIAKQLGADFIDASEYETSNELNPHPDILGMKQIAGYVLHPVDTALEKELVPADSKITGNALTTLKDITSELSKKTRYIEPLLTNGYIESGTGNFVAGSYFVSTENKIQTDGNEIVRVMYGEEPPQNCFISLYDADDNYVKNINMELNNNEYTIQIPSNVGFIIINAYYGHSVDPAPYSIRVAIERVETEKDIYFEPTFVNGYIESGTGNFVAGSYFVSTENKIQTDGNQFVKLITRFKQPQACFISAYDSESRYMFNEDMIIENGEYKLYISDNVKYIIVNISYGERTIPSVYQFSVVLSPLKKAEGINFDETPRFVLPFMPEIPEDSEKYFRAVELNEGAIRVDSPTVFWDSLQNKWGMVYTEYLGTDSDQHTWHGRICVAHSYDLENWVNDGVILDRDYDTEGAFDRYGLTGSYIVIKDNTYYLFYVGSPIGGWYESGELKMGLAIGKDLMHLERYSGNPIMAPDMQKWYKYKLYKTQIVKVGDTYYNFFNAAYTPDGIDKWIERLGFATSTDLIHWEINDQPLFEKEYHDLVDVQHYKHFITGDPCIYDIGDQYYYMDLFTAFNQIITWTSGGTTVSYARTKKENFPYGWEIFKWSMSRAPFTKSTVAFRGNKQYKFFTDYHRAVMGCKYE